MTDTILHSVNEWCKLLLALPELRVQFNEFSLVPFLATQLDVDKLRRVDPHNPVEFQHVSSHILAGLAESKRLVSDKKLRSLEPFLNCPAQNQVLASARTYADWLRENSPACVSEAVTAFQESGHSILAHEFLLTGGYVRIPLEWCVGLGPPAETLCRLVMFAPFLKTDKHADGSCYASKDTLAGNFLGVPRATLFRHLKQLDQRGWIKQPLKDQRGYKKQVWIQPATQEKFTILRAYHSGNLSSAMVRFPHFALGGSVGWSWKKALLFSLICTFNGVCWKTPTELAKVTGIARENVTRIIQRLIADGFLIELPTCQRRILLLGRKAIVPHVDKEHGLEALFEESRMPTVEEYAAEDLAHDAIVCTD